MPPFDGANPHPIYLGLLFCGAALFFSTFMGLLLWNNKRKGYSRLESESATPRATGGRRAPAADLARSYTAPTAAATAAQPDPPTAPAGPPVRNFSQVLYAIGPGCIHLLIVGETHSGKSTSARAVLAGRIAAGDQIAILDPHGNPTNWGGIRATGAGRDFVAIEVAMVELLAEMTRRYQLLADDASYQPAALSIFVDEWPAIQTACKKSAAQFITELAQEGRKVGMRLVMLTQSDLVASLGIEGKGDIRSNFTMLLLGGKASARADVAGLTWPAALRRGEGVAYPAITDPMPGYEALLNTTTAPIWRPAARPQLPGRPTETRQNLGKTPVENGRPATPPARQSLDQAAAGEAPTAPDDDPDLDPLWAKFLNGEDLLEPAQTSSQGGAGAIAEGEPTAARTSSQDSDLAALYQAKPVVHSDQEAAPASVPATLPSDELSVLIRAAAAAGMSRNKMTQLLVIPGGRADQLRFIRAALGDSEGGAQ